MYLLDDMDLCAHHGGNFEKNCDSVTCSYLFPMPKALLGLCLGFLGQSL